MAGMENGKKVVGEEKHCQEVLGWAARDSSGILSPFNFSTRNTGDDDVALKILYCGICHSDLHAIKNEWEDTIYPIVPGHEIVGIVTEAGCHVKKCKIGDKVGVGCLIGSCHSCNFCKQGLENYCPELIFTYNSINYDGSVTYGGYSDTIIVPEHFIVLFPENVPLDRTAPLLCAGITVYSPMKYFGLNEPGKHVGVVGLGGLGHLAVKFGKAFGMKITVISSSPSKEKEALDHLGADAFLVSTNSEQMKAAMGTMDGIINTVSASHSLMPLILLLKTQGKMIMLGAPEKPLELSVLPLLLAGKTLSGSCLGGMRDTQEMIDFAGKHNITADIELIPMDYVNKAMERLARGDVRYRFVIDVGNSLTAAKL